MARISLTLSYIEVLSIDPHGHRRFGIHPQVYGCGFTVITLSIHMAQNMNIQGLMDINQKVV